MASCTITVRAKVDTEALEALRVMHLRLADELAKGIEQLSRIGEETEDADTEHED